MGRGGHSLPSGPLVSALWVAATPNLLCLVSSEMNTEVTTKSSNQISPATVCEGHIPEEMMDQMLLGNEWVKQSNFSGFPESQNGQGWKQRLKVSGEYEEILDPSFGGKWGKQVTQKHFGRLCLFSAHISIATQNHRRVEVGRHLWRTNSLLCSKQSQLQSVYQVYVQS